MGTKGKEEREKGGGKGWGTKGGGEGPKWVQVTEGRERGGAYIFGAGGNETQEQGLNVGCFLFIAKRSGNIGKWI